MPVPSRPIDIHEDAIVAVYDRITYDDDDRVAVLAEVAAEHGLKVDRLEQLVATWCAIGGLTNPVA